MLRIERELARFAFALSVTAILFCGPVAVVHADTGAEAGSKMTEKKAVEAPLSGGQLYAIHCSRCHSERYPTEFTKAQWKTVVMHMRVRANLPAKQAEKILKYLQENN